MDYSCICGRRFTTDRGMKIHRTEMGCLSMPSQQQRTDVTDKTLENQSQLKARHSALSTPESARKKRSQKRKNQERFIRDQFQFARQLFQQPKSGTLTVDREDLETHLKKTYPDPTCEIPLEETKGFVWPVAPGIKFDSKPPSLQEVIVVVNKAGAKSSLGPNGVFYLLYKICPNVLKKLQKILQSAWKNIKISKEWMASEGAYIPKEQVSKGINHFRPISLLNVEGKIFFSIMASRLTKYLTENGYINTSFQKGGIPGVSGCLEHATMIWEGIQRAKSEKLNLDVVWLDLANAYGSVPLEMIQLVLRMYHVPEVIQLKLDDYFSGFRMRFSTNDYTTNWINFELGIAMDVILKAAEGSAGRTNLGGGCSMPPQKAFMDDTTITCSKEDKTRRMLTSLDVLMSWSSSQRSPAAYQYGKGRLTKPRSSK
ncbi:reverse transcriptase [Plakobranchus ocellatus]|uniref:Reverse transcriptase n=1 Tax=Plakobranchus ocellatus TaxID=259542 RepID=A0AAV4DV56_9GAST|nr:reverse transcriptase [Plakobranchus ocellatus]